MAIRGTVCKLLYISPVTLIREERIGEIGEGRGEIAAKAGIETYNVWLWET